MQVQLQWTDPHTGVSYNPQLNTPIAFGRDFALMPADLRDQPVSRMVLQDDQVEPYHALLEVIDGSLRINDRGSRTGTKVNGLSLPFQAVGAGDRLQIGAYEITVVSVQEAASGQPTPNPAAPPPPPPPPNGGAATASAAALGAGYGAVAGFSSGQEEGAAAFSSSFGSGDFEESDFESDVESDGTCNRRIGFLVKRRCGRTTPQGCPHCHSGQVPDGHDPYAKDYDLYPGYGQYGRNYWGYHYYSNRSRYYYDPGSRRVDFTEADAASFEQEGDQDYEIDLDAS